MITNDEMRLKLKKAVETVGGLKFADSVGVSACLISLIISGKPEHLSV